MTKYRANRYGYKAWQIEEEAFNKKKKEHYWRPIKYPGNVRTLVAGMVDLGFGDFTADSMAAFNERLDEIEDKLAQTLAHSESVEWEAS